MLAITNSTPATKRGTGPVHMSSTTTSGTIAMRKSERRFGSAVTVAPRPTALATSGDEDDTGPLVLRRPFAAVVLAEAQHACQILARLGDVGNPPHRLHPRVARVVRGHRERHVAGVPVEQPLQVANAALDVVAGLEHVRDLMLGSGRGHELHQPAGALRRDRAMVEPGLGLDHRLHEGVLDVVHARELANE